MTIAKKIKSFLARGDNISYQLYGALVTQARTPGFYADADVPDSLDGRFDMIVMHSFLVIRRLNDAGEDGKMLAQNVFDDLFLDMDQSLREIGAGDLSVPKKIKVMAKAFYGRCTAYQSAMDAGDKAALRETIVRNIYADTEPRDHGVAALTEYMFEVESELKRQDDSQLLQGEIKFPTFAVRNIDQE